MKNSRIRVAMTLHSMKQWELAEIMGMSEASVSRLLRHELPEEAQDRIIEIIEKSAVNESIER